MKKALEKPETSSTIPFPTSPIIFLCIALLAHCLIFTAPLPYVAFMIVDFGLAKTVDEAGYTAGWISSMFMIGRLISGLPWGYASDYYGRKKCLFLSIFNLTIFGFLFGFSQNFLMAISIRFLIGVGNGFMTIAKTYISEVTLTKEHELRAFSYFNGVYGLGLIVGPVIGGLCARPAIQYPNYFPATSIWGRYPYLLPSLLCSIIAAIGDAGIFFCLPETLPSIIAKEKKEQDYQSLQQEEEEEVDREDEEKGVDGLGKGEDEKGIELTSIDQQPNSSKKSLLSSTVTSTEEEQSQDGPHQNSILQFLLIPQIRTLLIVYMFYCFICILNDEVFPLYAVTSLSNGGLAWETVDIGEVLATGGLILSIYQFFFYERIMKTWFQKYNEKEILMINLILSAITIPLLPLVANGMLRIIEANTSDSYKQNPNWTRNNLLLKSTIVTVISTYNLPSVAAFISCTMLSNSLVDSSVRGRLNGLMAIGGKQSLSSENFEMLILFILFSNSKHREFIWTSCGVFIICCSNFLSLWEKEFE